MSPDPNTLKASTCETNDNGVSGSVKSTPCVIQTNNTTATTTGQENENNGEQQIMAPIEGTSEGADNVDVLVKPISLSVGRERRNVPSPSINLQEVLIDPQSPSSSSSTSQATSANDATFEPTIEMMVNDFDDEQTLNEEEAMAALESQDPDEEINTLKEESEMPLEELLAKYSALPPHTFQAELSRKKSKKSSTHKKKHKPKQKSSEVRTTNDEITEKSFTTNGNTTANTSASPKNAKANLDLNVAESGDERDLDDKKMDDYDEEMAYNGTLLPSESVTTPTLDEELKLERIDNVNSNVAHGGEIHKVRRSHLLDLYPEGTFDNVVAVNDAIAGNSKDILLETLYGVEDDDDEDEEIEEEEDEDYKKKVMIGASYQATIPVGLSQYGDILPYENEDKLIWEPSQVSEREVEEYLLKIRDIKSNQQGEDEEDDASTNNETNNLENLTKENGRTENNIDNLENNSLLANGNKLQVDMASTVEIDSTQAVVKDNEQALHLLVQCGYDFKEALRRKRLNALPLNDCMSLWSEEECHKFEEGIQKYGKDFLKIRQNQVRTRTMRELVQFYYLWKKSERRDHNFANADTVDHMDIYLNEDNEYGSNPASVSTPLGSPVATNCTGTRRNSNASQKNISIMTTATSTTNTSSTNNATTITAATNSTTSEKNISNISGHQQQHHHNKRRTHSNSNVNTNDFNHETSVNTLTNSTK